METKNSRRWIVASGILAVGMFAAFVAATAGTYENGPGQKFLGNGSGTVADPFIPRMILDSGTVTLTGVTTVTSATALPISGAVTGTVVVSGSTTSTAAASEVHVGEVGGNMTILTAELTRPSDTNAYTAGDVVSNSTTTSTMLTFTNAARINGGSGYIVLARAVTDKKSITPRLDLQVYNDNTATIAGDNVLHAELYADIGKRIGNIVLPAMSTPLGTTNSDLSRAMDATIRVPYKAAAGTRNVYVLVTTLDAFTPASAEKVSVTLGFDNN